MRKSKKNAWGDSVLSSTGIGLGVSIVVTVLGMCIGALFIINEYLKPETTVYVSVIIRFLATFTGAVVAGKIAGENMPLASVLTGASYFAALVAVALLVFDGIVGGVIWGIIAVSVGIGGAILLCIKVKTPHKRRRRNVGAR